MNHFVRHLLLRWSHVDRPAGALLIPTYSPLFVTAIKACIDADSRDRRAYVGIDEEPEHLGTSGTQESWAIG